MKLKFVILIAVLLGSPALAQVPDDGAKVETYSFKQRQSQLVELARTLGGLHHYHKICRQYDYRPGLFRDRMKELITFEDPQIRTKEEMIAAFNLGVKGGETKADYCDYTAEQEMRRLGGEGLVLSERLARPFRQMDGYDYYTGVEPLGSPAIENGVRVYRGGN